MEQKLSLEALTLADIQPSQFYISGEKPRRVLTWFDPADLRNFEPCPVYEFQGKAVFTDGHTRALRPTEWGEHSLCNDAEWFLPKRFTEAMALIYIPPGRYFPESMIERMMQVFA